MRARRHAARARLRPRRRALRPRLRARRRRRARSAPRSAARSPRERTTIVAVRTDRAENVALHRRGLGRGSRGSFVGSRASGRKHVGAEQHAVCDVATNSRRARTRLAAELGRPARRSPRCRFGYASSSRSTRRQVLGAASRTCAPMNVVARMRGDDVPRTRPAAARSTGSSCRGTRSRGATLSSSSRSLRVVGGVAKKRDRVGRVDLAPAGPSSPAASHSRAIARVVRLQQITSRRRTTPSPRSSTTFTSGTRLAAEWTRAR